MTDTVSTTHPLDSLQQDVPEQDKLNHAQMIHEMEVIHPPVETQGGEPQHGDGKAEEEHTLTPVTDQGHRKGLLSGVIGTAGAVAGSVAGKVLDVIGVHNPFDYDHEASEEPIKGAPETHGTHQHESQSTPLPSWSQEPRESFSNNTPRGEREGDVEGLSGREHQHVTTEGGREGMVTDRLTDAPADQQPLNVGEGFIQDAPEAEPGAMMGRGETSILGADERRAATEPAENRGQETMYPSVRDHIGATDKTQAYTQPSSGLLDEQTGAGLGTSAGESARAGEEPMTAGLRLRDTPLPTPVEQRDDADSLNLVYDTVGKGKDQDVDVHNAPKGKDVEVGAFNGVVLLGGDHNKQGGDAGYVTRDDAMRGTLTRDSPAGNLLSPGGDSGYMSGTSGEGMPLTLNQMSQPVAPLEEVKNDPAFQGQEHDGYHRCEGFDVTDKGGKGVRDGPVVGGEQQETLTYGKGGEYGMDKGAEGLGGVGTRGDAQRSSAEDAGFKTVPLNDEGSLMQQDQHEKKHHQHHHVGGGVRDRDDFDDDNSTGTGTRGAEILATGSRDHHHHHEHDHHNIPCVPTGCMPGLEALGNKLGLKKH